MVKGAGGERQEQDFPPQAAPTTLHRDGPGSPLCPTRGPLCGGLGGTTAPRPGREKLSTLEARM